MFRVYIEICSIVVLSVYLPCLKHRRKSINILSYLRFGTNRSIQKRFFLHYFFGYFASLNMTKDSFYMTEKLFFIPLQIPLPKSLPQGEGLFLFAMNTTIFLPIFSVLKSIHYMKPSFANFAELPTKPAKPPPLRRGIKGVGSFPSLRESL